MKHESRGAGKGTRGLEERQKRSGIGGRVSERLEGVEIVGIRGKGGEKGDIIAVCTTRTGMSMYADLTIMCKIESVSVVVKRVK